MAGSGESVHVYHSPCCANVSGACVRSCSEQVTLTPWIPLASSRRAKLGRDDQWDDGHGWIPMSKFNSFQAGKQTEILKKPRHFHPQGYVAFSRNCIRFFKTIMVCLGCPLILIRSSLDVHFKEQTIERSNKFAKAYSDNWFAAIYSLLK